ncbi:MAG: DUF1622 domain-containing protein [Hyphomicrobiales bacterium]|nr:DUF1622 domain-containing protein [Hyphomicrobiales bacterium]MBV9306685.1 DUF1622 domain-containing protein [Acidobacteriaceae bacterium]
MHAWLVEATKDAIIVIDAMVLAIIAIATVQAFFTGLRVMLSPSGTGRNRREVWLHYARWLVAALSFQLAADILATSIAPSWDELMRLAIVAVIRILLNLFLERDVSDMRDRQSQSKAVRPIGSNEKR